MLRAQGPNPRVLSCGFPTCPQLLVSGPGAVTAGRPCSRAGAGGGRARPSSAPGKPELDPRDHSELGDPLGAPGVLGRLLSEATTPPAGTIRRGGKRAAPPPTPLRVAGPGATWGRWKLAPGDWSLSKRRACTKGLSRAPGARLGGQRSQPITRHDLFMEALSPPLGPADPRGDRGGRGERRDRHGAPRSEGGWVPPGGGGAGSQVSPFSAVNRAEGAAAPRERL